MTAFPTPAGRPPRILGVFAHPDDEIFCLGGTVARYVAEGGEGAVVSLTQGEGGQIRDASVASRRTLAEVRARELRRAGKVLGMSDTACLGWIDGTLPDQPLEPMVDVVRRRIDEFRPDVVVSFGPDGGYGHPDHVIASTVATEAAAASAVAPTVLYSVFPRSGRLLVQLLVDWLASLDDRHRGSAELAHGLMLFANGSSIMGFAADRIEVRFYPAGTYLIEQGSEPDELFVVLSGHVQVVREEEDGARRTLARSGPGSFLGEEGLAASAPRNAHVIADDNVTCFVLAPGEARTPTGDRLGSDPDYVGTAQLRGGPDGDDSIRDVMANLVVVDVSDHAARKMEALACHRSQYPIPPDAFPPSILQELFGTEYFTRVR